MRKAEFCWAKNEIVGDGFAALKTRYFESLAKSKSQFSSWPQL